MNFIFENWPLILVAVVSGGLLLWPMLRGAGADGVTTAAAVQLINREKAQLIDVCEAEEFAAAHAGGARNIPLNQLEAQLPVVVKNKSTPLILICASGARARRAAGIARKLGYEQPRALAGGLAAWRESSLPVESAAV